MWLRSFERFFGRASPLRPRDRASRRELSESSGWSNNALMRVVRLSSAILTEERVDSRSSTVRRVEPGAQEGLDPYIEKLVRHTTPEGRSPSCGSPSPTCTSCSSTSSALPPAVLDLPGGGRIVFREVRRSDLVALLIDRKWKPVHDGSATAGEPDHPGIPTGERRQAQGVLELFRLLHYLEYADPAACRTRSCATPSCCSRWWSPRRGCSSASREADPQAAGRGPGLHAVYDAFVYCIRSSSRSGEHGAHRHLGDRQAEGVRSRVENGHGILKDCFQQSVVQLAQALDPSIDGRGSSPTSWPGGTVGQAARRARRRDPGAAGVPGGEGRGLAARMKDRCRSSTTTHQVPDVQGLVGVRAVLHRGPQVRQRRRAPADRAPLRDVLATLLREVQKRSLLQGEAGGGDAPRPGAVSLPDPRRSPRSSWTRAGSSCGPASSGWRRRCARGGEGGRGRAGRGRPAGEEGARHPPLRSRDRRAARLHYFNLVLAEPGSPAPGSPTRPWRGEGVARPAQPLDDVPEGVRRARALPRGGLRLAVVSNSNGTCARPSTAWAWRRLRRRPRLGSRAWRSRTPASSSCPAELGGGPDRGARGGHLPRGRVGAARPGAARPAGRGGLYEGVDSPGCARSRSWRPTWPGGGGS